MKFLFLLLLATFTYADQYDCVRKAFKHGQPHDLGNTLAGIVWVESQCKYLIGINSEDYGITQININTLTSRLDLPRDSYTKSQWASYLVRSDAFALEMAIMELNYWRLERKRTNWYSFVSSYNEGSIVQSHSYAIKVAKAIQFLKSEGVLR